MVTDYSSEDKISLEEMGFDEDSWLDQIDTVYSPSEDATYISVRTDSYEQSDLIRLAGRFGLGSAELKSDGDVELSYASRDLETVLSESVYLKDPRFEYYLESGESVPLDVWVNDFRFGADFVGPEGLIVNHTDEAQSHDGVDYSPNSATGLGQQVAFQMPDPRGDELTTIIDYRTSAGNDVAWFPNHTDSYVNWSLGDDTWYAPAVDERLEVSYSESGLAEPGTTPGATTQGWSARLTRTRVW